MSDRRDDRPDAGPRDDGSRSRARRKRGRGRGPKRTGEAPDRTSTETGSDSRPSGGNQKRHRKRASNRKARQRPRGPEREQAPGRNDAAGFWGEPDLLPAMARDVRITDDPAAVPRSLGLPPLPGHEAVAEHYFTVVYERAVATAGALAAAGGLIDLDAVVDDD
jgi:hypothetical protein